METRLQLNPKWDKSNPGLLREIGWAYEKGAVFKRDYKAALHFYLLAGEAGDALAMNNAGWIYENGLGVERNVEKAVKLYAIAAKAGSTTAMVNLGNIYEEGMLDGKPDYDACYQWYRRAANAGDAKGRFNLANCYHWGHGVERDYRKAFPMFKEMADAGYEGAAFYAGLYYQEGLAGAKD